MIVFDHVSKVYPNGTVGLDDVDLTIADGEFAAIIGRSGAGKRSEEHTSELQSQGTISYAVFCLRVGFLPRQIGRASCRERV